MGLEFIDRPGGTSTAATSVIAHPSGPRHTLQPWPRAAAGRRVREFAQAARGRVSDAGKNEFVDAILAADPHANVIVLGDINYFEFSQTVAILEGGVLSSLMNTLPKEERYSYAFEGNSQVLDQILVSGNLLGSFPIEYDVVHVNSDFADQASDHDPQVARLDLRGGPEP